MSQFLHEGAVFANRYRIVRCIARGGMGAVYEVIHLETERRRALKVMHAHTLQSDDLRERFKREAKVAAQVESDFIVDVFDAGVDEATEMPFLVMELLRGEELGKRLKRLGRLAPEEVVAYLHQTALALDKTHKASIVHRDLKPENLFLTDREDGPPRVKVLDFGIAKIISEGATTGATTQSIGTPLYMSPEQFNPAARLSGASDIYSLGMVAYALLVGSPYWAEEGKGGNVFAIAVVAIHGPKEPASVRAARRGVALPPGFDIWFARVTAVDPAQRHSPATAAVRELAQALGVPLPAGSLSLSMSGHVFGAPVALPPAPIEAPTRPPYPSPFINAGVSEGPAAKGVALAAPVNPGALVPLAASFAPVAGYTPGTVLFQPPSIQGIAPQTGPEATGTTSSVTGAVSPGWESRSRGPLVGMAVGVAVLSAGAAAFIALRSPPAPAAAETEHRATPSAPPSASEVPAPLPPPTIPSAAAPTTSATALPALAPSSAPKDPPAPRPIGVDKPAPVSTSKSAIVPAAPVSSVRRKYSQD